jgi:hypothetical protein
LRECPARLTAQLSRENGLATLVIGTAWSGFTIVWDDGETDLVRHNDMKKIERAPTKLVGVPGSEHRLAELAEISYSSGWLLKIGQRVIWKKKEAVGTVVHVNSGLVRIKMGSRQHELPPAHAYARNRFGELKSQ